MFLIVDGNALLHRSYHGGSFHPEHTRACFNFFQTLFMITNKYRVTHCFITWDNKAEYTWRYFLTRYSQAHPDVIRKPLLYKSNRDSNNKQAEMIRKQKVYIKQLLNLCGIYQFEPKGTILNNEADDIIGSSARIIGKSMPVIILTSDKDITQCVSDTVCIYNPNQAKKDPKKPLITPKNIKSIMGVYASQIPDYLTLCGDSIDSIQGVNGIGSASAIKLLDKYKTLEGIFDNINELPPNFKKCFKYVSMEDLKLTRLLVTLNYNAFNPSMKKADLSHLKSTIELNTKEILAFKSKHDLIVKIPFIKEKLL